MPSDSTSGTVQRHAPLADPSNFYGSKKLILELLQPKLDELVTLSDAWTKKSTEGGIQISLERFQSLLNAVIAASMFLPQLTGLETALSSTVESTLVSLADKSIAVASNSVEPHAFVDATLRLVRPCFPSLSTGSLADYNSESPGLLLMLSKIFDALERREARRTMDESVELMDIDQEFDSQASKMSTASTPTNMPRYNTQLCMDARAFYTDTRQRLRLLHVIHNDEAQLGLIPDAFVEDMMLLSDEALLSCQQLLMDIFRSDLIPSAEAAANVIERLGAIVSQSEYQCSEVALTTCIEVVDGLHSIWQVDNHHLSELVGDLYNHFIKVCLTSNILSQKAQMSLSRLLLTLLRTDPEYGTKLGVDSCRTSFLYILSSGPMAVKYFIGERIAEIFDLYILKLHDEVFVDVLDSLPKDPDNTAGIAFRLLVLSKLACRWSTLLRRCTYHVFETPGKIGHSVDYATQCLYNIAKVLELESPKQLFRLFSRQLLYTWLEHDVVEDIPYSIFGFTSLKELLQSAQAEATGLMIMRGQGPMCTDLAERIGSTEKELIRQNFTTAMAYSMIYGDAFGGEDQGRGESYVEEKLGSTVVAEARHSSLVDMIALFFDLIDQDNPIEKTFLKNRDLAYAGEIMKTIKGIAHSPNELPPNQQPMFKSRYLIQEIRRLCEQTGFEVRDLWTPSLVVAIARKLLNTVHPALGSLHACSVLRKVRILICLAGPVALETYVLEMLLNSTRSFIVDAECADDALGVSQYLLSEGSQHLSQNPSFVAGYALSTLASLRVFLESTQASTTQESQFLATMDKAQHFHEWLTQYLSTYTSTSFKSSSQQDAFRSITESAAHIRSSGNAEKGTPESKLLLDILRDGSVDEQLLNESSRQLALGLLCNDFVLPAHGSDDIIGNDEDAVTYATEIWKSCQTRNLSNSYLSWAGRVVGRSFSASGDIPLGVLRETELSRLQNVGNDPHGSEMGLIDLLQQLTSNPESATAGLAEAALRKTISQALADEDNPLVVACQRSLTESLFLASQWGNYQIPPSELGSTAAVSLGRSAWTEDISSPEWLTALSVHLAQSVPQSIVLAALPPILKNVRGFAKKAFPFIVHLVLLFQLDQQQTIKRSLSSSMKKWLTSTDTNAKDNLKLLLNTILYLRTQEYPKESSLADRTYWLEIDYSLTSAAATRCGMYKTALLFTEVASSDSVRASRRSSAILEADLNETLLTIFENIDDPDAYYGLPEDASLSKVLARVEYENEGSKSLAFRGAQYDSNLRQRDPSSDTDAQALVRALNTLGLSGLSHSLLQTQQSIGAAPSSLENTFGTARKLEIWNLPAPSASNHHAVVVYRALQSMHQAVDVSLIRSTIYDGFRGSMQGVTAQSLNASTIRQHLGSLAALAELDELMNIEGMKELEEVVSRFQSRGAWMKRGR
jgi:ataxia telangiectasia mutated family protein